MAASVNILTGSLDSTHSCATDRWTSLMKKTLLISLSMDVYSPRMAISPIKFHWAGWPCSGLLASAIWWAGGSMMAKWHSCFFPLQWAGKGPRESSEELNLGGGVGVFLVTFYHLWWVGYSSCKLNCFNVIVTTGKATGNGGHVTPHSQAELINAVLMITSFPSNVHWFYSYSNIVWLEVS